MQAFNYYNLSSSPIPSYPSSESFSLPLNTETNYTYAYNGNYDNGYKFSSPSEPNYYYKPTMPYTNYSSTAFNETINLSTNGDSISSSLSSSYSYYPSNCFYTPISSSSSSVASTNSSKFQSSENLNSFYQNSLLNESNTDTSKSNQNQTSKSMNNKKGGNVSRKHMLPDEAVDILNEWFDEHITNPYPQMEEKERLAKRGKITLKQVNAWFSNRRNRSQNTKPKRIQRDMENKMSGLIQELTSSSNGTNNSHLLEKFRQVLADRDVNKF